MPGNQIFTNKKWMLPLKHPTNMPQFVDYLFFAKYLDNTFCGTECNLSNQLPSYLQVWTFGSLEVQMLNWKPYHKTHSEIQIPQDLFEQTACFLHTLVFCYTPRSAFPIVFTKSINLTQIEFRTIMSVSKQLFLLFLSQSSSQYVIFVTEIFAIPSL